MSRKKCPIDEKTLGGRLRIFRESKGFNIVPFANLLSISHGSLSDIENNKSKPSSGPINGLIRKTDINIYWLFTGEGEMGRGTEKDVEIREDNTYIYKEEDLDSDPDIADLLKAARRVLKSENKVAFDALERNIRYFDHSIKTENRLKAIEAEQTTLKDTLAKMEKRFEKKEEYPERKVAA